MLSPSRITLENNEKIRPQPDRENALAGASGGAGGIRTHGTITGPAVFKTAALDRSATAPEPFLSRGKTIAKSQESGLLDLKAARETASEISIAGISGFSAYEPGQKFIQWINFPANGQQVVFLFCSLRGRSGNRMPQNDLGISA